MANSETNINMAKRKRSLSSYDHHIFAPVIEKILEINDKIEKNPIDPLLLWLRGINSPPAYMGYLAPA